MKTKSVFLLFFLLFTSSFSFVSKAQIISAPESRIRRDSLLRGFDSRPYFGLYKDNYFIGGGPLNHRMNKHNSNVKFQISISQKLTKSTLPWDTYLFLFYTQKVFWNVFEESLPMTDLNFNPGIGLARPLFVRNNYIGKLTFQIEHESNGKDGDDSRSWNRISLGANIIVDRNLMVHGKAWIPIIDGKNNKDILDYCGIYQTGLQLMSNDGRFNAGCTLVKRRGWKLNYNVMVEAGMRLWKNANEYLFIQFYNGYGEGLLDYNRFHSMIRIGIQIKPELFSDY